MGRIKYTQIIVMVSKEYEDFPQATDQEAFQIAFSDQENAHWYSNVGAFIEDLKNYDDLNDWQYRLVNIPDMVLRYLMGSSIEEDNE